jgi:hypothetical protein
LITFLWVAALPVSVRSLDSLSAWTNPERPSTPSYGAIARYAVRSRGLAVLVFAGVPLAVQVATGQYAVAALVVGSVAAFAVATFAGVAVAFDDAAVAVVTTVGTVAVLAANVVVVRTLGLVDGQMLGIIVGLGVVPGVLAAGTAGYTVAERVRA